MGQSRAADQASTIVVPHSLVIAICLGASAFVLVGIFSVCIYVGKRRTKRSLEKSGFQFLLPKDAKPVIALKTAAGPGGLKKSPSPVQSPDNPIGSSSGSWSVSGGYQNAAPSGSPLTKVPHKTSPVVDCEMDDTFQMRCSVLTIDDNLEHSPTGQQAKSNNLGSLSFVVRYNFEKNALMITIAGAKDLPSLRKFPANHSAAEHNNNGGNGGSGNSLLDPYVKLQLLPEKQHKVKTRVVRNTVNPTYDEDFTFYGINYNQLQSTTLHFAVLSFDRYSRDEILGEVLCPLQSIDLSESGQEVALTRDLINRPSKFQNSQSRGEVLVSLCHQPAASRMTVVVLKAKNLPKFDVTGLADPYVKVNMLVDGQRVAKKKTHVKKRTLDPVYNESFMFELPAPAPSATLNGNIDEHGDLAAAAALDRVSFECLVMDWDRVTKNEVMGRFEIGARAKSESGRAHWEEVKKSARKQVAEWHELKEAA